MTLREQFPLRLFIGSDDASFLLDDGFTFSNVDPGGFEAASFNIPKDMPQTLRGQPVRLDCGLRVAFEGRVSQVQRSLGNKTAINCEGYGALLKENTASMVFCDRDLTRWIAPTYARQVSFAAQNIQVQTSQVAADPSGDTPAIVQLIQDQWVPPYAPICEAWYDSGPENLIEKMWIDVLATGVASTVARAMVMNDPAGDAFEGTGNLADSAEHQLYFTPNNLFEYAVLQFYTSTSPYGSPGGQLNAYWKNAAVYGDHGLTGRGTNPVGFYPSDIVTWALTQIPALQRGVIPATDGSSYVVSHSVYYTPVPISQITDDMSTAQGWHWGVWASQTPLVGDPRPRLDFRPRAQPGGYTAFCRRRDCDTLDIREDISQQYNRAIVNFTNVDGTSGAAIVTLQNAILDAAGIRSRTVVFNGGTMTPATAPVFGLEALAILNAQQRVAGSADIVSAIDNPNGPMPAWLLKAGIDRLRIADLPSFDSWGTVSDVPISRVECSVSSSGMNTTLEFGSGGNLVETLQARVAAAGVLASQGGA